jgi:hypothetical protein
MGDPELDYEWVTHTCSLSWIMSRVISGIAVS